MPYTLMRRIDPTIEICIQFPKLKLRGSANSLARMERLQFV